MDYCDREPDLNTESFNAWAVKKEDSKGIEDDAYQIDYHGEKIGLCGFTLCKDKETDKLMFAYKWRHDKKLVIYYLATRTEETEEMLSVLKAVAEVTNYAIQDFEEIIKNILSQKHTFDKLGEKK